MEISEFDLIVIGTGPGGEGAAIQVAKQDRTVAVIERADQIGGACTHLGTIPSKALRFAISQMMDVNRDKLFHWQR